MVFRTAPASRGVVALILLILAPIACFGAPARADSALFKPWNGPAAAFALPDSAGVMHSLAPHPAGIVLVHFFATWCEPCREELPALTRLARRVDAHARVIAISVAEPAPRVSRFLATVETGFPVLLDADRAVARAWGVSVLPTSFVLDGALAPRLSAEETVAWDKFEPRLLAASFKTDKK